jgi:hypothetical protein
VRSKHESYIMTVKMFRTKKLEQTGMVSILVTLIMAIVITLIILGFGQVAQNNQREVLDRQLASQAYYAAETGVDDVLNIYGTASLPSTSLGDTNCANPGTSLLKINRTLKNESTISSSGAVSFTCLIVTNTVSTLTATVSPGSSQVLVVDPSGSAGDAKLEFTWQAATTSGSPNAADCPTVTTVDSFDSAADWSGSGCNFGVLRADIFDASNGITNVTTSDPSNTAALYMVPTDRGGVSVPTTTLTNANGGGFGGATIAPADCNDTNNLRTCSVFIDTGKPLLTHNKFYVRLSGIYESLGTVSINGTQGTTFSNGELVVDSTGKAQDELKRIQVVINLNGNQTGSPIPSDALDSVHEICKHFSTLGGSTTVGSLCNTQE